MPESLDEQARRSGTDFAWLPPDMIERANSKQCNTGFAVGAVSLSLELLIERGIVRELERRGRVFRYDRAVGVPAEGTEPVLRRRESV